MDVSKINDEVRELVAEELGEDENQDHRFQLLQKYGIAKPQFTDRTANSSQPQYRISMPDFKTAEEARIWKNSNYNPNSMTLKMWEQLLNKQRKSNRPHPNRSPRPQNLPRSSGGKSVASTSRGVSAYRNRVGISSTRITIPATTASTAGGTSSTRTKS